MKRKWLLPCSLALNAVFLVLSVAVVARRGGLAYLASGGKPPEPPPIRFVQHPNYLVPRAYFESLPRHPKAIVFLGDSLTARAAWPEILRSADVLNRGIVGDNTEGVLLRLPEILRHQPRQLFVMIGINDLWRDHKQPQDVIANWRLLVQQVRLKAPRCQLVLQSVLPVNPGLSHPPLPVEVASTINSSILSINRGLRALADGRQVLYLDIHSALSSRSGVLDARYTDDGIHVNAAGYAKWIALLRPVASTWGAQRAGAKSRVSCASAAWSFFMKLRRVTRRAPNEANSGVKV